ncbi:MAG: DUF3443 family protein [Proteobacteria bacterium]|nr:MAG: DUF3443 family protein [Pseudomonadota bacterium]
MKLRSAVTVLCSLFVLVAYNNCAKSGFEGAIPSGVDLDFISGSNAQALPIVGNEPNVMKITLGCGYVNEPCVSVTICQPGTTTCQTIPNILLDTGSYGLRLFSSAVTLNLNPRSIAGGTLTECVSYADGTSQWGPVKVADVMLGQRKASAIGIHVIDSAFGTIPSDCTNPESSASAAGYNGILGVGLFTEDCGTGCANGANNRIYFSCSGPTCSPTTVPIAQQVSNPVSFLPVDNNGVALQFAAVPSSGVTAHTGWLVLGIGTQANNVPSGVVTFPADSSGNFQTTLNGKKYSSSFIDSGSNGLFFPGSGVVATCSTTGGANGFFCPASLTTLSAVQSGKSGSPSVNVSFQIANAEQALAVSNPNIVFNNLGGSFSDGFDWGLPFYLGRTIFSGIDGKASSLGTGPYYAW